MLTEQRARERAKDVMAKVKRAALTVRRKAWAAKTFVRTARLAYIARLIDARTYDACLRLAQLAVHPLRVEETERVESLHVEARLAMEWLLARKGQMPTRTFIELSQPIFEVLLWRTMPAGYPGQGAYSRALQGVHQDAALLH